MASVRTIFCIGVGSGKGFSAEGAGFKNRALIDVTLVVRLSPAFNTAIKARTVGERDEFSATILADIFFRFLNDSLVATKMSPRCVNSCMFGSCE